MNKVFKIMRLRYGLNYKKTKYSVVYSYYDDDGKRQQKWETWGSYAEAKKRKAEIELKQANNTFVRPNIKTVSDLMYDFMELYGVNKWSLSTQEEMKEIFGNEYYDYNIVMSLPNGRPMEGQVISRSFKRLIRKNNLPDVVFHSLRHSSTTYKLKLNGGDMKSVQGDTGHAQLKMVSDVYSHILDEDRRHNAEMFEDAFYKKTPTAQKKETSASTDAQQVMELLNASPDLASQLFKMLQIVNGGTQNAV